MTLPTSTEILARAAAAQRAWATLSVHRRCTILGAIRREIGLQCELIAEMVARETSKPLLDALSGDVLVTLEQLRYYGAYASRILHPRRVGKPLFFFRGARFEIHCEPHGVALIFGPSNYPFQLSVIPLITALVAGNAVVLKCSERTPETAALIARLCAKANLPRDLVQVLHDSPAESAALIDARPDFIFFTGSSRHGQQVAQRAANHLIPTVLELGGKDASLVFGDCYLERAVEGITYGAFSNAGRVCVSVKRAYVEASIYDEFLTLLKQRTAKVRVGLEPDSDFHPLPEHAQSALRVQVEDALSRGATLHWPPHPDAAHGPVLLTNVPADARILTEESFGPALCLASFATEAEAIVLANTSPFALSSSIWTRNRARGRRVAAQLSAGSCAVNDVIRTIANPYAAFGGNRFSGYGRYHGPEGLRAFSRTKTIMLASDRRKREINWFPFDSRTRRRLASLLRFRHGGANIVSRLSRALLTLLMFSAILSVTHPAASQAKTHLTIKVRLTEHAHGELGYLIFTSSAGFPGDRDNAVRHGFLTIPDGVMQLRIEADLPPGTYAVSLYEDSNGNHKLDRNLIGIPKEPVGVSGSPSRHFGPPRFDECSFRVGEIAQTITIRLVHGS